jgi:hypothetical protein
LCFFLLTGLASAVGPAGKLYFTAPSVGFLGTLQGTDEIYTPAVSFGEGPIAVYGAVATTGIAPLGLGASYDLNGNATGTIYSNPLSENAYDATTDGTANYLLGVSGTVYQASLDYATASPLFSADADALGISFDRKDNAFWITGGGFLKEYNFAGDLLNAYALNANDVGAVAYDPLDDTVWVGGSVLTQYATDGTVLGAYALSSGYSISGMEFDLQPVPEPASLAAIGVGVLALLRRRSVRKKAQ